MEIEGRDTPSFVSFFFFSVLLPIKTIPQFFYFFGKFCKIGPDSLLQFSQTPFLLSTTLVIRKGTRSVLIICRAYFWLTAYGLGTRHRNGHKVDPFF